MIIHWKRRRGWQPKRIWNLQVIFRGTYWLRFWSQLQREEQAKTALSLMRRNIENIAMEFINGGWNNFYRLL
ncbi:hypothetical protein U9M48_008006 [Paspalum notatum var. saurae]|uniref:Uncharacterized protein n=1 Tax=Paspalum notatum var. saurae TaxID=547442 RepID=A0AAQ3SN80_PASNO